MVNPTSSMRKARDVYTVPDDHQGKLGGLGKIFSSVLGSAERAIFILLCQGMAEAGLTSAAMQPHHVCCQTRPGKEEERGNREEETRGNQGTCFWLKQLTAPAPC